MEGSIKDSDLPFIFHKIHAGLDAHDGSRVMQGRKFDAFLDLVKDIGIYGHRRREILAAMYHAMPNRIDLIEIRDSTGLRIDQDFKNGPNRIMMVLQMSVGNALLRTNDILVEAVQGTYALAETFRNDRLSCHVDELILQ